MRGATDLGPTSTDARFAAELAERAGRLLVELRAGNADSAGLGRRGDLLSNAFLTEQLTAHRPDDAVLSEEAADDKARLDAKRVWIIDPLDGTREFAIPGRTDWAVHVALWEAGAGVTAAAVALPALGVGYATDDRLDPPRGTGERLRILVSDSRPPGFAGAVAAEVGGELVPMGSAGAKAMTVVRGEADAYLHAGGQWEWDSAAPVGVALAAGLHAARIDGAPARFNAPHPYLPDLLICRPELADKLVSAVAAHA